MCNIFTIFCFCYIYNYFIIWRNSYPKTIAMLLVLIQLEKGSFWAFYNSLYLEIIYDQNYYLTCTGSYRPRTRRCYEKLLQFWHRIQGFCLFCPWKEQYWQDNRWVVESFPNLSCPPRILRWRWQGSRSEKACPSNLHQKHCQLGQTPSENT